MFCHKCGNKVAENAGFCHKCGAKMVADQSSQQAAAGQQATDDFPFEEELYAKADIKSVVGFIGYLKALGILRSVVVIAWIWIVYMQWAWGVMQISLAVGLLSVGFVRLSEIEIKFDSIAKYIQASNLRIRGNVVYAVLGVLLYASQTLTVFLFIEIAFLAVSLITLWIIKKTEDPEVVAARQAQKKADREALSNAQALFKNATSQGSNITFLPKTENDSIQFNINNNGSSVNISLVVEAGNYKVTATCFGKKYENLSAGEKNKKQREDLKPIMDWIHSTLGVQPQLAGIKDGEVDSKKVVKFIMGLGIALILVGIALPVLNLILYGYMEFDGMTIFGLVAAAFGAVLIFLGIRIWNKRK
jgi:hypothetical protein